jgi:hypothetical protein
MTNHGDRGSARWRVALKRIASGPLLGYICLALAPFVTAVWWVVSFGDIGWFILDYAIVLAAAALNASAWLAAILFGTTRQLRGSWFVLLGVLGSLIAAAAAWPHWANDFAIVLVTTLIVLGFPSSMIFKIAAGHGMWLAAALIGMLASAYLQAFVLLPLLFRWRADAPPPERSDAQ